MHVREQLVRFVGSFLIKDVHKRRGGVGAGDAAVACSLPAAHVRGLGEIHVYRMDRRNVRPAVVGMAREGVIVGVGGIVVAVVLVPGALVVTKVGGVVPDSIGDPRVAASSRGPVDLGTGSPGEGRWHAGRFVSNVHDNFLAQLHFHVGFPVSSVVVVALRPWFVRRTVVVVVVAVAPVAVVNVVPACAVVVVVTPGIGIGPRRTTTTKVPQDVMGHLR